MIYHVLNFKNIRFRTLMIRSDLCDYSDTYIVVKGTITRDIMMLTKEIKS